MIASLRESMAGHLKPETATWCEKNRCRVESNSGRIRGVKQWEIIADNLHKAGAWAGSQPWIAKGERSGLLMLMATESVSLSAQMKS